MVTLQKILLAEDNPKDIELTLAAMEHHNLANRIDVVNDGEEALDYLYKRGKFLGRDNGDPLAILLDIKMPKVDGLEVLKIIKEDDNLKNIPVIMLTSSQDEKDLLKSYNYGVNSYVVKPVNYHDFVDAISRLGFYWVVLNKIPPTP